MNPSLKRQLFKTFAQMLKDLKDRSEVELFLSDLLSERELQTFLKRVFIPYWLKKGRDKDNIKRNLAASQKEIDEGKKYLDKKGLKLAIKYMEAEEWSNQWAGKIKKITKRK